MAAALSAARSFLAFDYGTRRVGVASGNALTGTAQPLTTVQAQGDARFAAIARLIAEWRPDALVVGVPFHPDGAAHDNTRRARTFGRQLSGRFKLPVHEVDERYSTTEALASGAGRAASDVDAVAAAIILEQFLRGLPGAASGTGDTSETSTTSRTSEKNDDAAA
jgi:putative Holliday junction resolvase